MIKIGELTTGTTGPRIVSATVGPRLTAAERCAHRAARAAYSRGASVRGHLQEALDAMVSAHDHLDGWHGDAYAPDSAVHAAYLLRQCQLAIDASRREVLSELHDARCAYDQQIQPSVFQI